MTQFRLSGSGPSMFRRPPIMSLMVLMSGVMLAPPQAMADSMRCDSRIVTVEARAADILAACGEPDFRDVFSYPVPRGAGVLADVEQWTYNFGPNKLLHVLKLRNGRLIRIDRQGYGFRTPVAQRCAPGVLANGLSKYRLLQVCGEPLTRRDVGFITTLKPGRSHRIGGFSSSRGHYPTVTVFRQEWVYNFGSRYLLKVVTLDDGVIADVQNGDRGFNR